MRICPSCQAELPDDAIFCDQCGARVAEAPAPEQELERCPQCGAPVTPGELFCGNCGAPLEAPAPGAAETMAATPESPPPETSDEEMTCPFCGATVLRTDDFCFACGAALSRVAKAATPAPTEPEPTPTPAPANEQETQAAPDAPPEIHECPSCGAPVIPGEAFCEFCGAALITHVEAPAGPDAAPQPAPTPAPAPAAAPQAEPNARLIVDESGIELPVKASGETLVGREDPVSGIYPDVDLTPHGGEEGGVSRRHFKIQREGARYVVEDLNSTNSTMVNKKGLQPGVAVPLEDGDEIRAGRVALTFRIDR